MAIADRAVSTANSTTQQTSLSWSHTVAAGSNRVLIVWISIDSSGGTGQTYNASATYNGVSMTRIANANDNQYGAAFVLVAPAEGTNTVQVSWTGSQYPSGNAISYSGVDQTTPNDTPVINTSSSGTSFSNAISSATGDMVLAFYSVNNNTSPLTATGSGTSRAETGSSPYTSAGVSDAPGASSVTTGWSWPSANRYSGVSFNLNAAGGTTWNEAISDALTAAESLAAALTGAGSLSDAVAGGEALAAALGAVASLSDAATGGESLAAVLGGAASLSDAATLADSLAAAVAMVAVVADGGTLAEALAVALTGNASLSDSATGGDAVSLDNVYDEALSDALTAADSLAVGLVVLEALAGSVAGADALAAALAAAGSTADAAAAADALAATLAAVASLGGGGLTAVDSLYLAPLTAAVPPARRTYRLNAAARRAVLAQQLRAYVLAAASRTTRLPEDDET